MSPSDWLDVAKTFGLPACLLAYFIWQDYLRNRRDELEKIDTTRRLRELEDFQKVQILKMTQQVCTALANSMHAVETISRILQGRPCIASDMKAIAKTEGD